MRTRGSGLSFTVDSSKCFVAKPKPFPSRLSPPRLFLNRVHPTLLYLNALVNAGSTNDYQRDARLDRLTHCYKRNVVHVTTLDLWTSTAISTRQCKAWEAPAVFVALSTTGPADSKKIKARNASTCTSKFCINPPIELI